MGEVKSEASEMHIFSILYSAGSSQDLIPSSVYINMFLFDWRINTLKDWDLEVRRSTWKWFRKTRKWDTSGNICQSKIKNTYYKITYYISHVCACLHLHLLVTYTSTLNWAIFPKSRILWLWSTIISWDFFDNFWPMGSRDAGNPDSIK